MRGLDYIRYYQSFPSVIPVCRASSLRVTHPSALASLCKHRFAKDLHVLSILSAFILSQDQTLHSIYFHIFNSTFCLDENLILRIRALDITFIFYTLLLLLFLYHCPVIPFRIDGIYITIFLFPCQLLFFKKFGFFVVSVLYNQVQQKIYKKNIVKMICWYLLSNLERIILDMIYSSKILCNKVITSILLG